MPARASARGSRQSPVKLLTVGKLPAPAHAAQLLDAAAQETRDWRKVPADEVRAELERCKTEGGLRELLATLALGTVQACIQGSYDDDATLRRRRDDDDAAAGAAVSCGHAGYPISRGLRRGEKGLSGPPPPELGRKALAELLVADLHPLDVVLDVLREEERSFKQVAVVHALPLGEVRGLAPSFANYREAQLYVRTPYLQALEVLDRHVHGDPLELLTEGGLIYTPNVAVLRGAADDGFPWLPAAQTACDIICCTIPRQPARKEHNQYANADDKATLARTLELVVQAAVNRKVDVLVLPPIGLDQLCMHPSEDAADVVHSVISKYREYFDTVILAWYGQPRDELYIEAFQCGRRPIPKPPKVTFNAAVIHARNVGLKPPGIGSAAFAAHTTARKAGTSPRVTRKTFL